MKFNLIFNITLFHTAIEFGRLEIIKILLSHQDIDINKKTIYFFE